MKKLYEDQYISHTVKEPQFFWQKSYNIEVKLQWTKNYLLSLPQNTKQGGWNDHVSIPRGKSAQTITANVPKAYGLTPLQTYAVWPCLSM